MAFRLSPQSCLVGLRGFADVDPYQQPSTILVSELTKTAVGAMATVATRLAAMVVMLINSLSYS